MGEIERAEVREAGDLPALLEVVEQSQLGVVHRRNSVQRRAFFEDDGAESEGGIKVLAAEKRQGQRGSSSCPEGRCRTQSRRCSLRESRKRGFPRRYRCEKSQLRLESLERSRGSAYNCVRKSVRSSSHKG